MDMLDLSLLKNLLIIASAAGIIESAVVQKIKENLKVKKYLLIISVITAFVISILFTKTFTSYGFQEALWVALFTFVGADLLYKTFEDKIFASFSVIQNKSTITNETMEESSIVNRIER